MTLSGHFQGDHVHHESPSLSPTKMSERVPPIGAEDSSCDDDKSLAGRSEEVEREESDQNYANDLEVNHIDPRPKELMLTSSKSHHIRILFKILSAGGEGSSAFTLQFVNAKQL